MEIAKNQDVLFSEPALFHF